MLFHTQLWKSNVGMHYELISFILDIVIDIADFYILVCLTDLDLDSRPQVGESKDANYLNKFSVDLDGIWSCVETC